MFDCPRVTDQQVDSPLGIINHAMGKAFRIQHHGEAQRTEPSPCKGTTFPPRKVFPESCAGVAVILWTRTVV